MVVAGDGDEHDMETIIDSLGDTFPAPEFTIPDGCEVWAIHMPLNVSLKAAAEALEGVELEFNSHHKHSMGKLTLNGGVEYSMIQAEASNNMRVLTADMDDERGDDDGDETHFMKIGPAFDREIKLVASSKRDEVGNGNGHADNQSPSIIRAYEYVTQMKNMKRRLTVPGQYACGKPGNFKVEAGKETSETTATPAKKVKVEAEVRVGLQSPKSSSKKKKKEKKEKKEKKVKKEKKK